jgi:hypothetical protein
VLLHFHFPRPGESAVVHPFFDACLRELRDRFIAALCACVAPQAYQRSGPALLVDAWIEQILKTGEHLFPHVEVGNHQAPVQR